MALLVEESQDSPVTSNIVDDSELQANDEMVRSFTLRALLVGLCLGVLVNLSNTYYGLRIGVGSQMSMVSGLLGFVVFKLFSKHTTTRFTAAENVLVISVATATGCMPFTAGFIGIIPALEYLIGPDENGPLLMSWPNLVLWSMGLCLFGLIFAFLLRDHFVLREKLPWPGPKANAHMINTLHRKSPKIRYPPRDSLDSYEPEDYLREDSTGSEAQPLLPGERDIEWKLRTKSLVQGAGVSGIMTIFMYFVPIFHEVPIFGSELAHKWFWTLDISPGFFGQGIITGPTVPLHMLFGSIVGWGILSPYAKHRGWAPGQVDDWETGSRGWIIWVSLAALLADASVKLAWFFFRPLWEHFLANGFLQQMLAALSKKIHQGSDSQPRHSDYREIPAGIPNEDDTPRDSTRASRQLQNSSFQLPEYSNPTYQSPLSSRFLGLVFLASVTVSTLIIHRVFGDIIPWYYTVLAIAISLPMAIVGIRSLAETDYNPESALVSQLLFASLISHSNPNGIIINLLSAAVAQAGANQAGEISYDLKVGSLVGARPEAQIYGQIIGSLFGALISSGIYKLYASQYPIPGSVFRVPSSFLVLSTARLVMGRGLPDGVAPFAIASAVLSAAVTIVKMRYASQWWQKLVPSGVSFAIGIYNMPSFTLARAAGGIFFWAFKNRIHGGEGNHLILATGLVLGESVASLVSLALTAMQAPQVGRS